MSCVWQCAGVHVVTIQPPTKAGKNPLSSLRIIKFMMQAEDSREFGTDEPHNCSQEVIEVCGQLWRSCAVLAISSNDQMVEYADKASAMYS